MEKLCATFSGHRPDKIYGYNNREKYRQLVDRFEKLVDYLYDMGVYLLDPNTLKLACYRK